MVWYFTERESSHKLSCPINVVGQYGQAEGVQEFRHPGYSQFPSSVNADLPASRLL